MFSDADTDALTQEETGTDVLQDDSCNLIVWNDEVNTFE